MIVKTDGSFAALVHTGGGAPEAELPRLRGHDPGEAAEADRVGAGQQLGPVLRPVIAAWAVPPVDMVQRRGQDTHTDKWSTSGRSH